MDRFACREAVVAKLKEEGLLVREEAYLHNIGHCYRCQTVVEPAESMQWFVKTKPLAEPAIEAVAEGGDRIIPAQWEKTYFEWMENIRDGASRGRSGGGTGSRHTTARLAGRPSSTSRSPRSAPSAVGRS
jgi:valyl-tRNA synthetase